MEESPDYLSKTKKEIIDNFASKLNKAYKKNRVEAEIEIDYWFEFIQMPSLIISNVRPESLRGLLLIYNNLGSAIEIEIEDILFAHQLLREYFDYELAKNREKISSFEIKGYILSEAIKKHIFSFPESLVTKSQVTQLMKIRLLDEIGFFQLLSQKEIKSATDIGILLSIILNADESNMRKIAANVLEPKSSINSRYDFKEPNTERKIKDLIKEKLPNSTIF